MFDILFERNIFFGSGFGVRGADVDVSSLLFLSDGNVFVLFMFGVGILGILLFINSFMVSLILFLVFINVFFKYV